MQGEKLNSPRVKNKQHASGNLWDEVGWYNRLSPAARVIPKHLIKSWQYLKAPGICTHRSHTDNWVRSVPVQVMLHTHGAASAGSHGPMEEEEMPSFLCSTSGLDYHRSLVSSYLPLPLCPLVPGYFQLLSVTEPGEAMLPWLQSTAQPATKLRHSRTRG